MKKRMLRSFCCVMAGCMLFSGMPQTIQAQRIQGNTQRKRVTAPTQEAVTVSDYTEFARALANGKKNIVVEGSFTIRDNNLVETNGQMRPLQIPGGTKITGNGTGNITCSHPIQIMGDNVEIKDIQWCFSSTDSMNSVPHREIFLGGHSLILDNVNTYLEGGNSLPGSFEGTEKELLPTVYAGGYYDNSAVGNNASLIVKNANSKTMFQDIYMGHEAAANNRTAYSGVASLEIDANAKVRNVISAENTTLATFVFEGKENGYDEISPKSMKGNKDTTLKIRHCAVSDSTIEGIENIILEEAGRLQPGENTGSLSNISLEKGGCLDFTKIKDAVVTGNFLGGSESKKGMLVLNKEGSIQIAGNVSGITQFQVGNHVLPGTLMNARTYITALNGKAGNFVLSDKDLNNNYSLIFEKGKWTAYRNYTPVIREVGSIEIKSGLSDVLIGNIPHDIQNKTVEAPYLNLVWKDKKGMAYTAEEVDDEEFLDNMVVIQSDDWKSDDEKVQQKTDWNNPLHLEYDGQNPDQYYLIAHGELKSGTYTLLFFSDSIGNVNTVADVKALKNKVMASLEVTLAEQPDSKPHAHVSGEAVTENEKKPTCTEKGSYDKVIYCKECKEEIKRETVSISALGHLKGDPVIENRVEPKIGVDGSYEEVIYCTTCNKELSRTKIKIPALKEPTTSPEKPGTENPGTGNSGSGNKEPGNPGTEMPAPVPVPGQTTDHKHSYTLQETKEATCKQEGEQLWKCSCGDSYTEKIAKKSHILTEKKKKATVGENGSVSTVCSVCKTVLKKKVIHAPTTVKVEKERYIYDGKAKKPDVKVVDNQGKTLSSSFYKIVYKDNKDVGKATVTVHLTGNYSGTLTETFEICPKDIKISDIRSTRKSFILEWGKQETQADGYEIVYTTDKAFSKKSLKTVSVKNTQTVSKEIKGLKENQKYYVRIRTYKDVKLGEKRVRIYSNWSNQKMVVTKNK